MLVSRVKLSAETESLSRTPYTADNLFLFPLDVNNNGIIINFHVSFYIHLRNVSQVCVLSFDLSLRY